MYKSYSAGGVVVNATGEVAVVQQKTLSWTLPKGHIEVGEDARQAAEREIFEETGVRELTFVKPLGSYDRPKIHQAARYEVKNITLFLYTTSQTELAPQDKDILDARWIAYDAVAALLTHEKDKSFYEGVMGEAELLLKAGLSDADHTSAL